MAASTPAEKPKWERGVHSGELHHDAAHGHYWVHKDDHDSSRYAWSYVSKFNDDVVDNRHQDQRPRDVRPGFKTEETAKRSAERHHVIKHYGLSEADVKAVHAAWPEGPARFYGMHPDQVKHEVERAHSNLNKSESKPAEQLKWSNPTRYHVLDGSHRHASGVGGYYRHYQEKHEGADVVHDVFFYPGTPGNPTGTGRPINSMGGLGHAENALANFKTQGEAESAASHHHAAQHYGLSSADIEATHRAWPEEGPKRFIGMHPDQVKHELARAHAMEKSLRKAEDKKPAEPLKWGMWGAPGHWSEDWHKAEAGHGYYLAPPSKAALKLHYYEGPNYSETEHHMVGTKGEQISRHPDSSPRNHVSNARYVYEKAPAHESQDKMREAAEHHHAAKHYGLSDADVAAVHAAWPEEGPRRFIGMHPDQVKHEVARAHAAMEKSLVKAKDFKQSKPLRWKEQGGLRHAETSHGHYWMARKYSDSDRKHFWEPVYRPGPLDPTRSFSELHHEYKPVNDASPGYSNRAKAYDAVLRHHVIQHYGLKPHEVAAVKQAWPDQGVARFHGQHPEMVRHEVDRALQNTSLDKSLQKSLKDHEVAVRHHAARAALAHAVGDYANKRKHSDLAVMHARRLTKYSARKAFNEGRHLAGKLSRKHLGESHPADQLVSKMKKADFGQDPSQGIAVPALGEPMQTSLTGNGDPVLSDPKVKRFLQQLGTKMVTAQFGDVFKPGDRVIHPYLGMGKIIRVHDPAEADEQGGLLYDVRYPEFDIALNQVELMAVPPPPVNPLSVPIKANMRAAIPTAPPHPALQATVAMAPFMGQVAQAQQAEKEAQMEAMAEGQDAKGGDEGDDAEGGSNDAPPFGKSEALTKTLKWTSRRRGRDGDSIFPGELVHGAEAKHGLYEAEEDPETGEHTTWYYGKDGSEEPLEETFSVRQMKRGVHDHHVKKQFGLQDHEVAAVKQAWPEGTERLVHMHPDQVKHEVARAKAHADLEKASRYESKDKYTLHAEPLKWSEPQPDRGQLLHGGHPWYTRHNARGGKNYKVRYQVEEVHDAEGRVHKDKPAEVWVKHAGAPEHKYYGSFKTVDEAKKHAQHLHVVHHHGLKQNEVKAVKQAWPDEGVHRFIGMHPDQVKHEVARALEAHPHDSLGKAKVDNVLLDDRPDSDRLKRWARRQRQPLFGSDDPLVANTTAQSRRDGAGPFMEDLDSEHPTRVSHIPTPKLPGGKTIADVGRDNGNGIVPPLEKSSKVTTMLEHEDYRVRGEAFGEPDVTFQHISRGLKDKHPMVRAAAVNHRIATPQHIADALRDPHPGVRAVAARHENATQKQRIKAMQDPDKMVREEAIIAGKDRNKNAGGWDKGRAHPGKVSRQANAAAVTHGPLGVQKPEGVLARPHEGFLEQGPKPIDAATAIATSWRDDVKKSKKKPKNPRLLAETAKINENAKKPENQRPHDFKIAEWTHPNGHPRCLRCGGEESSNGRCSPSPNYGLSAAGNARLKKSEDEDDYAKHRRLKSKAQDAFNSYDELWHEVHGIKQGTKHASWNDGPGRSPDDTRRLSDGYQHWQGAVREASEHEGMMTGQEPWKLEADMTRGHILSSNERCPGCKRS